MELTPELFEKVEFTERRRGYDTEQVESFLEQAGTALAQLMGKVRQTEERSAGTEVRLAEMEERLKSAQAAAASARAEAAATPKVMDEDAEVEQAARTLLMARRTSEAIENESRDKAQSLLLEAKARADRQVQEAQSEADEILARARTQADREGADRRAKALDEVRDLEARRVELTEIVGQLDARLAAYRTDLSRAASELTALAEDPSSVSQRESAPVQPDEVIARQPEVLAEPVTGSVPEVESEPQDPPTGSTEAVSGPVTGAVPTVDPITGTVPTVDPITDAVPTVDPITGVVPAVDVEFASIDDSTASGPSTTEVAEVAPPSRGEPWGAGTSWSDLGDDSDATVVDPDFIDMPIEEPVTGTRDRFLDDLEQAVNDPEVEVDDAMTAFFEGSTDTRSRRFGWRR
jgi:DivIVA domain-containing protein